MKVMTIHLKDEKENTAYFLRRFYDLKDGKYKYSRQFLGRHRFPEGQEPDFQSRKNYWLELDGAYVSEEWLRALMIFYNGLKTTDSLDEGHARQLMRILRHMEYFGERGYVLNLTGNKKDFRRTGRVIKVDESEFVEGGNNEPSHADVKQIIR